MPPAGRARRTLGAWLFVYALGALCAVLGILQYRAIAEVSIAARERLRSSLEASLTAFSQDFNATVSAAAATLVPLAAEDAPAARNAVVQLYAHGSPTGRYRRLFSRIGLAVPERRSIDLETFDHQTGGWQPAAWPDDWSGLRARLESTLDHGGPDDRGRPEDRHDHSEPPPRNLSAAFETPLFPAPPDGRPRRGGPAPHLPHLPAGPPEVRREVAWVVFEVNVPYMRETLLPEMLQRHLGADYQAEVTTRGTPREILYRSDVDLPDLTESADASISLFDPQTEPMGRRGGGPGRRGGMGNGQGRGLVSDQGRWMVYVRHRAGSLEAVVAMARLRSMAVTAGVLAMLAATLGALILYTRRAQRLAELQMEFVAGVSHELRTPLTVIHTAAYNLRGNLAANPAQVERYGALIQRESGRLKELVEQVLRFAGANAGVVLQERAPVAVEALIEESVGAAKAALESAGCVVEKHIAPDLPQVLGDRTALRHALSNLLGNAAKHGTGSSRWIGLSASLAADAAPPAIEIRVADRGAGIPAEEQKRIFDPFFRGAQALRNQVHGTGLGLALVKRIVEAHGGSIKLRSEPMKGAEFIVRLPAAPAPPAADAAEASPVDVARETPPPDPALSSADPPGAAG